MRVPVVVEAGDHELDVELHLTGQATVADVAAAVARYCGLPPAGRVGGLLAGGAIPDPEASAVAVIGRGTRLSFTPPAPTAAPFEALWATGGLAAGQRLALRPGRLVVGRAPTAAWQLAAPSVSSAHAVVEVNGSVRIGDLGSTNGTRLGGRFVGTEPEPLPEQAPVDLGSIRLERRPLPEPALAPAAPARLWHRPPPLVMAAAPPAIDLPPPLPPAPAPPRLSLTNLVLPLALGAAMAVVWDPRLAVFALLGPVTAGGGWWEERRRQRRERRQLEAGRAEALRRLGADLDAAACGEAQRLHAAHPDLAAVAARIASLDPRLWERRAGHAAFLQVRVGRGERHWNPPVVSRGGEPDAEAEQALTACASLPDVPITADLRSGHTLGIAGPADAAAAVVRALVVQAASAHGPADVRLAILTSRPDAWRWALWLPHVAGIGPLAGTTMVAAGPANAARLARQVAVLHAAARTAVADPPAAPVVLAVVDDPQLWEAPGAPARALLAAASGVAAIAVAPDRRSLPTGCTEIVDITDPDGTAVLESVAAATAGTAATVAVAADGCSVATARQLALGLAPLLDAEATDASPLSHHVRLLDLLGLGGPLGEVGGIGADAVAARWAQTSVSGRAAAPIGTTDGGRLTIDLDGDGPHGLLAGTTGAGKSELLRTLVAALAASVSPDQLNFLLVDYKGGAAFDACARLPHVVGLVTDLDEGRAQRTLVCLDAELRRRERLLREVGATDLAAYREKAGSEQAPLPRLMVVIDEFATLAADVPGFVASLVGVAQRGRSLGVHLLLATQRPGGAVTDDIRANTNLRLALRTQHEADSLDVIGSREAAGIGRGQPGRGLARLGPGELVPFQTALVSAAASHGGAAVTVRPLDIEGGGDEAGDTGGTGPRTRARTDLDLLVAAVDAAWTATGRPKPRCPWPEPLPPRISLGELPPPEVEGMAGGGGRCGIVGRSHRPSPRAAIGLADDPERLQQGLHWWDGTAGNLLLLGAPGSGTTTALLTVASALARGHDPARLHLYALDFGAGGLTALEGLPHCGAVIAAPEGERRARLLRWLRAELDRRLAPGADPHAPNVVVLVDGLGAFLAVDDHPADPPGLSRRDDLARLVADGPAAGIWTVLAADHPNSVPATVHAAIGQRLVFRLADAHDTAAAAGGAGAPIPDRPGRAVDTATGRAVQVALPDDALAAAAAGAGAATSPGGSAAPGLGTSTRTAAPMGVLPARVRRSDLLARAGPSGAADAGGDLWLTIGVADDDLGPARLRLGPADHVLVAGPVRSGRSTGLATIAAAAAEADPTAAITAIAAHRSPLARLLADVDATRLTKVSELAHAGDAVTAAGRAGGRQIVVVDDADLVDDAGGALAALLANRLAAVHVVAAVRADALRGAYGHWTRELRRCRLGLALRPDPDDGDLWQTAFPRRPAPAEPGRGWLIVDGLPSWVQVALP